MTKVLYNADCSVCNFEISHYKKYADKQSIDIKFEDLNKTNLEPWGVNKDDATKRMHVEKDGVIYGGVDAFIKLWEDMPRYKLLANIAKQPGLYQIGTVVYDKILAPALYYKNKLRTKGE